MVEGGVFDVGGVFGGGEGEDGRGFQDGGGREGGGGEDSAAWGLVSFVAFYSWDLFFLFCFRCG